MPGTRRNRKLARWGRETAARERPLDEVPADSVRALAHRHLVGGQLNARGGAAVSCDWAALSRSEVRDVGVQRVERELERLGWSVRRSDDARSNLLLARRGTREIEVHVRVVRKLNYTYLTKRSFAPAPDRYVAYVRLPNASAIELYLIPSRAWETPDELLPSRDFGAGTSSEPEYGIQVSQGRLEELEQRFAWATSARERLG